MGMECVSVSLPSRVVCLCLSVGSLKASEIQWLLERFVFECLPLSTVDSDGQLTEPEASEETRHILWDDPVAFIKHHYSKSRNKQGMFTDRSACPFGWHVTLVRRSTLNCCIESLPGIFTFSSFDTFIQSDLQVRHRYTNS